VGVDVPSQPRDNVGCKCGDIFLDIDWPNKVQTPGAPTQYTIPLEVDVSPSTKSAACGERCPPVIVMPKPATKPKPTTSATKPPPGSACADPWALYYRTEPIASNYKEHSVLLRCPSCRSLYRFHPEERQAPARIDEQTARDEFGEFGNLDDPTTL